MKIHLLLILILILSFSIFAQNDTKKTIVLNQVVEITPLEGNAADDYQAVEITMNGKVLRKFSTGGVSLPQILGTFRGIDSDYVLYRTDLGSGVCAGGSLYVIKFKVDSMNEEVTSVSVAPVLTTCLGEFPVYGIAFNKEGNQILAIADHTLDLEYFNKWNEKKTVIKKKR